MASPHLLRRADRCGCVRALRVGRSGRTQYLRSLAAGRARRYLADIVSDISKHERGLASRLLLKAIRTLTPEEQDLVLAYLVDRALVSESAGPPLGQIHVAPMQTPVPGFVEHGWSFSSAPVAQWAAWLILRQLADGVTVNQLASELRLDLDVLQTALQDLAKRRQTSERLATILRKVAEGHSIDQAAEELGLTSEEVKAELRPTEATSAGFCAALMARSSQPRAPATRLGVSPQGPLRTMPVRFPEQQYQRLKDWSEQHNFPMAVVVRGVVERFLDEQQRGPV